MLSVVLVEVNAQFVGSFGLAEVLDEEVMEEEVVEAMEEVMVSEDKNLSVNWFQSYKGWKHEFMLFSKQIKLFFN